MISIDFECGQGHRFEGFFNDYDAYKSQLERKLVSCPLCESTEVTRKYSGCSIQTKSSDIAKIEKQHPNIFNTIKAFNQFVKDNFENVGRDFAQVARAIHYGIEEKRYIYGESSLQETKELLEDGINIVPLIDIDNLEN
jgi:hypothetical protein